MDLGNEAVLKVTDITKKCGATKALDRVSIEVKHGMIYGLIGENGAGKSASMRTIMGLISIDKGLIELSGTTGLQVVGRRMGQSVETSALCPELTARDNLHIRVANGGVSDREIKDLPKMMRLENTGREKAKNLSLGMHQRLTIANALTASPESLVLNELTNGMDPAGMTEMRETIQCLVKKRGITVLLSSHLLDELSQIATHYSILHEGHLIKGSPKEELTQRSHQFIETDASAAEQVVVVLDSLDCRDYFVQSSRVTQLFEGIDQVAAINRALVEAEVPVDGIHLVGQKLKDYFLQLAGGNPHV